MSRSSSIVCLLIFTLGSVSLSGCTAAGGEEAVTRNSTPTSASQTRGAGFDNDVKAVVAFLKRSRSSLDQEEAARLAPVIVGEARRSGFPITLVLAVIEVESSGDHFAESPVGALGLMQLLPATGEATAQEIGMPWRGSDTLFDPADNVRLGVAYLEQMVARFGDLPTALAAYNWGPTRISHFLERGKPVPEAYAKRVLGTYGRGA